MIWTVATPGYSILDAVAEAQELGARHALGKPLGLHVLRAKRGQVVGVDAEWGLPHERGAAPTIDWVYRILKEERDIVISSRPLEATAFQVGLRRFARSGSRPPNPPGRGDDVVPRQESLRTSRGASVPALPGNYQLPLAARPSCRLSTSSRLDETAARDHLSRARTL